MQSKSRRKARSGADITEANGLFAHDIKHHNSNDYPHFNEQQLSIRWGISIKKLQADRLKGGSIPFIRLGRAVRYRYADVVAWEERNLRTSTTAVTNCNDVK